MNLIFTRYSVFTFHLSAVAIASAYAALAWSSRTDIGVPLNLFGMLCVIAFVLSLFATWAVWKSPRKITFKHVLAWCVLVRLIAVCGEPLYEDDYYRYLWDGRQTVESGSPYASPPSAAFATEDESPWADILDNINYPELTTLYGPVNQYIFALAYIIAPGEIVVLQIIAACADLLVIFLLAQMASLAAVVLYGFSPLVIKEFAMTAHTDVISVAALLLAVISWRRERMHLVAVALALAVASKLFALLMVPLLLRWAWKYWLLFIAVTTLLYLPILGGNGPIDALTAMAQYWLFNAPIYLLMQSIVDFQLLKFVLLAVFLCAYGVYFFRSDYWYAEDRRIPRADLVFMGMLLAMPVFNPWYYVFVLAFAVIHPSAWAWLGSLLVLLAYATGLQLDEAGLGLYEQPTWVLWVEFVPIVLLMFGSILWKNQLQDLLARRNSPQ